MAELTLADAELLRSFGLTDHQRRVVRAAYREAPAGLIALAQEAREYGAARGNTGAGLLMHRIRQGEHYDRELEAAPMRDRDDRKRTGWRWTRGSHGETWVRDPDGRDVPPRGYAGG